MIIQIEADFLRLGDTVMVPLPEDTVEYGFITGIRLIVPAKRGEVDFVGLDSTIVNEYTAEFVQVRVNECWYSLADVIPFVEVNDGKAGVK